MDKYELRLNFLRAVYSEICGIGVLTEGVVYQASQAVGRVFAENIGQTPALEAIKTALKKIGLEDFNVQRDEHEDFIVEIGASQCLICSFKEKPLPDFCPIPGFLCSILEKATGKIVFPLRWENRRFVVHENAKCRIKIRVYQSKSKG
ncbi:MAG: hypothetical protein DRJ46_02455 [Thermoprotei archaeon]|nr:MAG: hypothetical protein DRJ46_02455 [Thermoprotei archaeon]